MSREDEHKPGLVPSSPAALSRAGAASLVRRGVRDLLTKTEADTWYQQGSGLFDQERHEEAAECLKGALELEPTHCGENTLLGRFYRFGRGVPQEAANRFRTAAEQGLAEAETYLGVAYNNGEEAPLDYANAVFWFHKAAE